MYWLEQTISDVPGSDEWLSAAERLRLSTLRFPKRRADWRLGRWTAKRLVAAYLDRRHLPLALTSMEVRASASGAPEIFAEDQLQPLSISISHCLGVGLCVLSDRSADFGCDIESVEPRSDSFLRDFFTAEEQRLVRQAEAAERPLLVNLLWSAKESTLKALRTGLRLDTRSVTVDLSGSCGWGDMWCDLRASHRGRIFQGCWREEAGKVRTIVMQCCGSDDQVFSTPPIFSISACTV